MKPNPLQSLHRELVSNFVRKRIEALNAARSKLATSPRLPGKDVDVSRCGDECGSNAKCGDRGSNSSTTADTAESSCDTAQTNTEVASDAELVHMGCPICIACFAGIQTNEQVLAWIPNLNDQNERFSRSESENRRGVLDTHKK